MDKAERKKFMQAQLDQLESNEMYMALKNWLHSELAELRVKYFEIPFDETSDLRDHHMKVKHFQEFLGMIDRKLKNTRAGGKE